MKDINPQIQELEISNGINNKENYTWAPHSKTAGNHTKKKKLIASMTYS